MKKFFYLMLVQLIMMNTVYTQALQVDSLYYLGDINKFINIVILGDGYTSSQQDRFRADADDLTAYLFTQSPWAEYENYFNVFAIRVISADSGATHPNTASDCNTANPPVPVSDPDTYLKCSFDSYGIHRLVVPQNIANVVSVLADNFPAYDQVFILSNTPYYGGSGGDYATSTLEQNSPEISVHQIGHSFAGLADEYWAGDQYAAEKPNMTQESDPLLVKWKNWVGYQGVGVHQYCCGGNSALWYKPGDNICKMEALGFPYCSVCKQQIIESIHALADPLVSYEPTMASIISPERYLDFSITELLEPIPNTLKITWNLDAGIIAKNIDSVRLDQDLLTDGPHTLAVTVTDTTSLLRVDNHATLHFSTVSWIITKSAVQTAITSTENKVACSLYHSLYGKKRSNIRYADRHRRKDTALYRK